MDRGAGAAALIPMVPRPAAASTNPKPTTLEPTLEPKPTTLEPKPTTLEPD